MLRAASAEFSTQSIAGTINIILKRAIKKGQRELKAGVGKGRNFLNPNVNLQLPDKAGQVSYSVTANALHRKYEHHSPTAEEGFDPSGRLVTQRNTRSLDNGQFNALNLSPRLNWTLANGDTITSQTFLNVNRYSGNDQATTVTTARAQPSYPRTQFFN